jgi:hypothetical protein
MHVLIPDQLGSALDRNHHVLRRVKSVERVLSTKSRSERRAYPPPSCISVPSLFAIVVVLASPLPRSLTLLDYTEQQLRSESSNPQLVGCD